MTCKIKVYSDRIKTNCWPVLKEVITQSEKLI